MIKTAVLARADRTEGDSGKVEGVRERERARERERERERES